MPRELIDTGSSSRSERKNETTVHDFGLIQSKIMVV